MARRDVSKLWSVLEDSIFSIPSTKTLFNQYNDIHPDVDALKSDAIRRKNLRSYLESVAQTAKVLVVGEAPGPWGCRFSGVPFVGEKQFIDGSLPFRGERSSRNPILIETKRQPPFMSNSSEIFWRVMREYYPEFLVWNSVPLHPHRPNKILTVRNPNNSEVELCLPALQDVIEFLEPRMILAIGRRAEMGLRKLDREVRYIRHPSRGGSRRFEEGIRAAFSSGI